MISQMSERAVRLPSWVRWRIDPVMAVVLTGTDVVLGVPDWTGSVLVVLDSLCMVGVCALVWWRRRFPITVAIAAATLLFIPCLNSAGGIVGVDHKHKALGRCQIVR